MKNILPNEYDTIHVSKMYKCTLKISLFLISFKDFNFPWLGVEFPESSLTLKKIYSSPRPFPDLWQPCAKDWNENERYPHHKTTANQQWLPQHQVTPRNSNFFGCMVHFFGKNEVWGFSWNLMYTANVFSQWYFIVCDITLRLTSHKYIANCTILILGDYMSTFSDYMITDSIELTTLPIVSKLITFMHYIDYI